MLDNHHAANGLILHMREVREHLTGLIPKLHEANERCAESAMPLAKLDDLNLEQRRELFKSIFAAFLQWEEVTLLVAKELIPLGSMVNDSDRRTAG